jgi:hypothetical protein
MQRVSEFLEAQNEPVSRNTIEINVSGKAEAVRQAITALVDEGYARESDGARGARLVQFVRPYHEDEDVFEPGDETTSSPPRPHLVPTLVSSPPLDLVSSSPSIGDEDEVERRPRPDDLALVSSGDLNDSSLSADFDPGALDEVARQIDGDVDDDELERMRRKVKGEP